MNVVPHEISDIMQPTLTVGDLLAKAAGLTAYLDAPGYVDPDSGRTYTFHRHMSLTAVAGGATEAPSRSKSRAGCRTHVGPHHTHTRESRAMESKTTETGSAEPTTPSELKTRATTTVDAATALIEDTKLGDAFRAFFMEMILQEVDSDGMAFVAFIKRANALAWEARAVRKAAHRMPQNLRDALALLWEAQAQYEHVLVAAQDARQEYRSHEVKGSRVRRDAVKFLMAGMPDEKGNPTATPVAATPADKAASDVGFYAEFRDMLAHLEARRGEAQEAVAVAESALRNARECVRAFTAEIGMRADALPQERSGNEANAPSQPFDLKAAPGDDLAF